MGIMLNGWQRVGIVLSVVWAIGGGFWGNQIGISQGDRASSNYRICLDVGKDDDACNRAFDKEYSRDVADHWVIAAIVGLIPIPIGWLAAYSLIGVGRWVRRGFKNGRSTLS